MQNYGDVFKADKAGNASRDCLSTPEKAFDYLESLLARKWFTDSQYEYEGAFCSGFWRGYSRLNRSLPPGAQKRYLKKCAESAVKTFVRDAKRKISLTLLEDMDDLTESLYSSTNRFISPVINAQVNELREALFYKEKALLELYLAGCNFAEIAGAIDRSKSTVRDQVNNFRKFARRFI